MLVKTDKIKWIIDQHVNTNHLYDDYLPYEYHLRLVATNCERFLHLMPEENPFSIELDKNRNFHTILKNAAWGHDLIEDTRVSYNDVKNKLGFSEAEIIYAVSNMKGKTRSERANDEYYQGIIDTPGAVFVKLCDRIANVQYSQMTQSRMFDMYKKENENFIKKLGIVDGSEYSEMVDYISRLFYLELV